MWQAIKLGSRKIGWGLAALLLLIGIGGTIYAGTEITKAAGLSAQPTRTVKANPVATPASSLKGTSVDAKLYSPILKREMPYRIYLPSGYATSEKRYPVLYMLHGMSGSYMEWLDYKLFDQADALMEQGVIKPMLIVLPSGDRAYWMDHANNGPQFGNYLVHDVVGYIDANYRTLPEASSRAIGGQSMGGHGALQLTFNNPTVFRVAGAHSPTLRTRDNAPDYFGDTAFFAAHDPISQTAHLPNLQDLKIWVDIGTVDNLWRPRTEELHQVLSDHAIPHEWHLFEGGHTAEYWIEHVPDYLKFYSVALKEE